MTSTRILTWFIMCTQQRNTKTRATGLHHARPTFTYVHLQSITSDLKTSHHYVGQETSNTPTINLEFVIETPPATSCAATVHCKCSNEMPGENLTLQRHVNSVSWADKDHTRCHGSHWSQPCEVAAMVPRVVRYFEERRQQGACKHNLGSMGRGCTKQDGLDEAKNTLQNTRPWNQPRLRTVTRECMFQTNQ